MTEHPGHALCCDCDECLGAGVTVEGAGRVTSEMPPWDGREAEKLARKRAKVSDEPAV